MKLIFFISSLFFASIGYSQTDSTDAVFDALFEAIRATTYYKETR